LLLEFEPFIYVYQPDMNHLLSSGKNGALPALFIASISELSQRANSAIFAPNDLHHWTTLSRDKSRQRLLASRYLIQQALLWLGADAQPDRAQSGGIDVNTVTGDPLWISVSYSHDWLACLISTDGAVGIDIEYVQRQRPIVDFAALYLNEAQLKAFQQMSAEEQEKHFYHWWTAMESVAKWDGSGITAEILAGRLESEVFKEGESDALECICSSPFEKLFLATAGISQYRSYQCELRDGNFVIAELEAADSPSRYRFCY